LVQTKIYLFKRKIQHHEEASFGHATRKADNNPLAAFSLRFTTILMFLVNGFLVKTLNTINAKDLNQYPGFLWAYAAHFASPMLVGGASFLIFVENVELRKMTIEKILNLYKRYFHDLNAD
jgi:hypothetical protein